MGEKNKIKPADEKGVPELDGDPKPETRDVTKTDDLPEGGIKPSGTEDSEKAKTEGKDLDQAGVTKRNNGPDNPPDVSEQVTRTTAFTGSSKSYPYLLESSKFLSEGPTHEELVRRLLVVAESYCPRCAVAEANKNPAELMVAKGWFHPAHQTAHGEVQEAVCKAAPIWEALKA